MGVPNAHQSHCEKPSFACRKIYLWLETVYREGLGRYRYAQYVAVGAYLRGLRCHVVFIAERVEGIGVAVVNGGHGALAQTLHALECHLDCALGGVGVGNLQDVVARRLVVSSECARW